MLGRCGRQYALQCLVPCWEWLMRWLNFEACWFSEVKAAGQRVLVFLSLLLLSPKTLAFQGPAEVCIQSNSCGNVFSYASSPLSSSLSLCCCFVCLNVWGQETIPCSHPALVFLEWPITFLMHLSHFHHEAGGCSECRLQQNSSLLTPTAGKCSGSVLAG